MDHNTWLLLDTLLAVVGLVLLISWAKLPAFLALSIVSLVAGLAAGLPPLKTVDAFAVGVGETLRKVALRDRARRALLGKMLEVSGGARQLAARLIGLSGQRGLAAMVVLVALLVGLSVFFPVGLVLMMPIVVDLAQQSGRPLSRWDCRSSPDCRWRTGSCRRIRGRWQPSPRCTPTWARPSFSPWPPDCRPR